MIIDHDVPLTHPINLARQRYALAKYMLGWSSRHKHPSQKHWLVECTRSRYNLRHVAHAIRAGKPVTPWAPKHETAHFETRIGGIPCGIRVTHYLPSLGWVQHKGAGCGPGDCDAPEYEDIEYKVLDRRGYPAPWIRVDRDDHLMILEMIRSGKDASFDSV